MRIELHPGAQNELRAAAIRYDGVPEEHVRILAIAHEAKASFLD